MEDLISRQTIIDGLEFVIEHGIETDGAHSISAEAMLEFVRELPTVQPESHWIPVAEQPPEVGKSVLICDAYGDICLGHRTQWGYYYPDFCEDKVKDVRAWCELPEPYKGATT